MHVTTFPLTVRAVVDELVPGPVMMSRCGMVWPQAAFYLVMPFSCLIMPVLAALRFKHCLAYASVVRREFHLCLDRCLLPELHAGTADATEKLIVCVCVCVRACVCACVCV